MHEGPGTDDSKKSQIRSVPCSIVYGDCMPIAECGALLPRNAAVNINFSPQKLWQPAVGKHTPHHSCKSSSNAFGHANLLRRIGAGVLERHPRLKAEVLELLADEFTSFVHPQPLDAESTWNHHRLCEYLK